MTVLFAVNRNPPHGVCDLLSKIVEDLPANALGRTRTPSNAIHKRFFH